MTKDGRKELGFGEHPLNRVHGAAVLKVYEKSQSQTQFKLRIGTADASLWVQCSEKEYKEIEPGDTLTLKKV